MKEVPGAQGSAEADAGASNPTATAATSTAAARDDLEELCFVRATMEHRLRNDHLEILGPWEVPPFDIRIGPWSVDLRAMARPGILLAVIAAGFAASAPMAEASQIDTQTVNLAASLTTHQNQFFRDSVPSACAGNTPPKLPSELMASARRFRSFSFTSFVEEPVCVTAAISTACAGADAIMSETYSPTYSAANILNNWIADLGNSPPAQTSYEFNVPARARFVTVVDEVGSSANCTSVTITWTSDRPWATGTPVVAGVPAVDGTLKDQSSNLWKGSPTVGRQWRRCDLTGAGCVDIPGATASDYTVSTDDVGHTIRVRQSATENALTSTVQSPPTTEVFIPFETHDDRLTSGDQSVLGGLGFTGAASRCGTATGFPGLMDAEVHFYDAHAFTSLMNEPSCVWVAIQPTCFGMLAVYNPVFVPSDQAQNFVASDDGSLALSYTLAPGAGAEAVIAEQGTFHLCAIYSLLLGSDGPFATGRPALAGAATEGVPLTTTNGAWSGSPVFDQVWLRCDATGDGCTPIGGATGGAYTPTSADVGHRLRSRVTATQVKSMSSDSDPSAVVVAPDPDRTAPTAKLRVARTTLQRVVKRGFIPVGVTCDENCRVTLRADVSRRLGKRLGGRRIGTGKGTGARDKRVQIRVKLTRRARRGLRGRQSFALTLRATVTDAAGNRGKATKRARVRRKRS